MRRNIAGHDDISSGVLRQRRDLYAISIALTLFYLAGAEIQKGASQGVLAFSVEKPWIFLAAAWVGYFYFLFRLSLLMPLEVAWSQYKAEALLQASDTPGSKGAVLELIPHNLQERSQVESAFRNGYVPSFSVIKGSVSASVRKLAGGNSNKKVAPPYILHDLAALSPDAQYRFRWSLRRAYLHAMALEHSFSNYVLPYLFAMLPLFLGIRHHWSELYSYSVGAVVALVTWLVVWRKASAVSTGVGSGLGRTLRRWSRVVFLRRHSRE